MARLVLSSNKAQPGRTPGVVSIIFDFQDPPFPRKVVEIRTAKDAVAALEAYAKEAESANRPLAVSGFLAQGDRAPAGFRKLRLQAYVNLDKPEPTAKATFEPEPKRTGPAILFQMTEQGIVPTTFGPEVDLVAAMEVRGFKFVGWNKSRVNRPELQGAPIFDKLAGPMWGGEDCPLRYEDQETNDLMSN